MLEDIFIYGTITLVLLIIIAAFANRNQKKEIDRRGILRTQLLDRHDSRVSTTRVSTGSALMRGIVGGAAVGSLGAIAGAATAKQKTVTTGSEEYTFRVYWQDNTVTVEKCRYGDYRYKRFIEKLDV